MPLKSMVQCDTKLPARFLLCLLVKVSGGDLHRNDQPMTTRPRSGKHQRMMTVLYQAAIERQQDLLGAAGCRLRNRRERIRDIQDRQRHAYSCRAMLCDASVR